jgi:hypothetical protein
MPVTSVNATLGYLLTNFWQAVVLPNFFNDSLPSGRTDHRGLLEVSLRPHRAGRPGAPRLDNFDPPKPPPPDSHCKFEENNPEHPWSIARRPWYAIEHGAHSSAAIPNGSTYVDDAHYLLVPSELNGPSSIHYPHEPQFLDLVWIKHLLAVADALGDEWAVGWNTLCAGATVDHRHAHLLKRPPLPCEKVLRLTVGDYQYAFGWPAGNLVIDGSDPDRLWHRVDRLQTENVPFNLLIRRRTVFLFGRRVGATLPAEFPGVMGLMELGGCAIVSDAAVFDALTAELLAIAMRKAALSTEELFNTMR